MGVYTDVQNEEDSILHQKDVEDQVVSEEDEIQTDDESNLAPISPITAGEQKIGTPQVLPTTDTEVLPDLNDPLVRKQMQEDEKIWWDMPRGDERIAAKDAWITKYWGSEKNYNNQFAMYGTSNPIESVNNTMQALAAMGQGLPDQAANIIGMFPGLSGIDNAYDKLMLKVYDNEGMTAVREMSQVVLPSILSGQWVSGLIGKAGYAGYLG